MSNLTRRAVAARLAGIGLLCALPTIAARPAHASGRVRIGYQKNGSLVIVRQQQRLSALKLPVDWVEFSSGPPMLEALAGGAIDFGATGDTPPIFAQAAGSDLLYVGGQPVSGANQAILVPNGGPIRQVSDLRGKRLAFTRGSSAHNMVVKVLASAGMTPADIQPVNLQPPDAAAAFRAGALDAWAVWDPFFAVAELEPTTRVLTSAEGVAPTNSFFLASRDFTRNAPEILEAVLRTINEAASWARENPDELARVMSAVTGVPLAAQRIAAPRGVYAVQPMDAAIIAKQQEIADSFFHLHIIPARIDVAAAVWRQSHG